MKKYFISIIILLLLFQNIQIQAQTSKDRSEYEEAKCYAYLNTDYDKKLFYLKKAFKLSKTEKQKSSIYLNLASINKKRANYLKARDYYYIAIKYDSTLINRCYTAIGDMYLSSDAMCGGSNPIEKRAYAIEAYKMYEKAGNIERQKKALKYFPSKEQIFQYRNLLENGFPHPDCWIWGLVNLEEVEFNDEN